MPFWDTLYNSTLPNPWYPTIIPYNQDYNLMWNTTTPRFSRCFLKTIPALVPCAFLWFFTPLEVYFSWWKRLQRTRRGALFNTATPIPCNLYNLSRLAAVGILVAISVVQFGYDLKSSWASPQEFGGTRPVLSDFWYSACNACTFVSKNTALIK